MFHKVFDGECKGPEIRMYEGNGDNPGSEQQRASRCAQACNSKKVPLSGSWRGFAAKGFVVIPGSGRCYCESSDSKVCPRVKSRYDRYDWGAAFVCFSTLYPCYNGIARASSAQDYRTVHHLLTHTQTNPAAEF